ncbi:T9SS type A sorting domain-containing protein [uncultured Algibacter sp.]|uniref:T9SS type A sorting domain-containing protein n=1 Tax=uncultured Algibacter sp. TaxID=298659 RepID=UPI0030EC9FD3
MKILFNCLFLFFICNVSFSQEQVVKNNLEETTVFKFYPNPVQDELFVLGTNKIKSIELINVLGKRVAIYHFNKSIIKMDVSDLKSGIYLIQATDENNKQETKRLVVK